MKRGWLGAVAVLVACGSRDPVEHRRRGAPAVSIVVALPDARADLLEAQVVNPIEGAMNTLPRLAHLRSTLERGRATIEVELEPDTDLSAARLDISHRLIAVSRQLPPGVMPVLAPALESATGAVLRYTLRSDRLARHELRRWQDEVARAALLTVPGIAEVTACGGSRERWLVEVDPARLAAAGATVLDVRDAAVTASLAVPTGTLDRGDARMPGAVADAVVKTVEPSSIRVRDLANVALDRVPDPCEAGDERGLIVLGSVYLQPGADPDAVRGAAERAIAALGANRPPAIALEVLPVTKPITLVVEPTPGQLAQLTSILGMVPGIAHYVFERERTTIVRVVPDDADDRDRIARQLTDLLRRRGIDARDPDELIVQLLGPDLAELETLAGVVDHTLAAAHVVTAGRTGSRTATARRLVIDRDAATRRGMSTRNLDDTVMACGEAGLDLPTGAALRLHGPDVLAAEIRTATGAIVPLSEVASQQVVREPSEIDRLDRVRWLGVRVRAGQAAIREALAGLALPSGYRWRLID